MNLSTAGLARSSANHPWRTVLFWIGLIVLSFGLVAGAGLNLTSEFEFLTEPESVQGYDLLDEKLHRDNPFTETVVVTSETMTVDDPAFKAVVDQAMVTLRGMPDLVDTNPTMLASYYEAVAASSPAAEQMVSEDRHTTLIPVTLLKEEAEDSESVVDAIDALGAEGIDVMTVGDVSIGMVFNETAEEDLFRAEVFSLPVTLIILVIVFGALVAAGLPIMLALISIFVAVGATAAISQAVELSFFITNMITMIGLAVGIDYALFIVERYREERRHGYAKLDAIEMAGSTASKAVLFSGITVVLALLGMFLIPTTIFRSLGLGAILVVIVAVLATLTLIPAVLSLLGDRIDWPRKRNYEEIARHPVPADADGIRDGFWGSVTRLVMGRPVVSLVIAVVLLVAAALPYLDLNTGFAGAETLPDSEARDGYEILQRDFSVGVLAPVEIVVDAQQSPEVDQAIQSLNDQLAANGLYDPEAFTVTWSENNDLAYITTTMSLDSSSPEAVDQIEILRDDTVPAAFGAMADDVYVTGDTAFNSDFFDIVDIWTPRVFAFVLGLSFLLLMVAFRSIIVPIKAILMNLLSVGAAYGLLVLVFQKGYLIDVFGFQQTPTIEAWIPIFLFCVLFGLSMDYHVFLLSRIREHYDQTFRNRESVAVGLQSTARIITGAALIMVTVFGGFASGDLVMFQQMGFGLAVAILIDATIVRTMLVPAAMALLGDRNWYLPRWLHWLPDVRVEGRPISAPHIQPEGTEGAVAD